MASRTVLTVEDVGGRFKRMCRMAPELARAEIKKAVGKTVIHLADEMYDLAPPRSDRPPHIKDAIDYSQRGLTGTAGILDGDAPAADDGGETDMGQVALFNEYSPNKQPFMRPAAEKEKAPFVDRVTKAFARVERALSSGA